MPATWRRGPAAPAAAASRSCAHLPHFAARRWMAGDDVPHQGRVPPNGACRWCGAEIRWVGHRRTGDRRPVDLLPEPARPAVLGSQHRDVVLIDLDTFLYADEAGDRTGLLRYRPHHVGCPN